MFTKRLIRLVTIGLCWSALVTTALAQNSNPQVLPPQSHPYGKTYGEWAAAWWQWGLGVETSLNPLIDPDGQHCAEGQSGNVWFLAGTFGSGSVTRTCTIPTGTALFFPLINAAWFTLATDENKTEEFARSMVECDPPTTLAATINGVPVNDPSRYLTTSPVFTVDLPEDNIYGLGSDLLHLDPSVDHGFYLFLPPLPPGEHVLTWSGTMTCPLLSEDPIMQVVTYVLTVEPR